MPTLASPSLPLGSLDGRSIPIGNSEFDSQGFLLYGNYALDNLYSEKWMPYLGAGIGRAKLNLRVDNSAGSPLVDDSDNVLIYNVRAGVNYPLNKTMLFSIEYNYLSTEKASYTGSTSGLTFQSEFNTYSKTTALSTWLGVWGKDKI